MTNHNDRSIHIKGVMKEEEAAVPNQQSRDQSNFKKCRENVKNECSQYKVNTSIRIGGKEREKERQRDRETETKQQKDRDKDKERQKEREMSCTQKMLKCINSNLVPLSTALDIAPVCLDK